MAFQVEAEAILLSANVPVQPNVNDTACNKAVFGVPPNVNVTLVSFTFVKAAGVDIGESIQSIPVTVEDKI